jgi:hypothetical protein
MVFGTGDGEDKTMADWKRYVNRTECWAREVTDDVEELVGSTGRMTAYEGDYIVNQAIRGSTFTFVVTADDFARDWRSVDEVDTDTTTSETGTDDLPGTVPPESTDGDNSGDDSFGQVATGGARAEASPADAPPDGDAVPNSPETAGEDAPPSPTASAPTSAASGDAETPAGNPPTVPGDAGNNPPDAVSPVSGTRTPPEPFPAPEGSGAGESSQADPAEVETATPDAEPATTTPTQTVDPASEPGGTGTTSAEEAAGQVETATRDEGGDAGATPTPTEMPASAAESPVEPATNAEGFGSERGRRRGDKFSGGERISGAGRECRDPDSRLNGIPRRLRGRGRQRKRRVATPRDEPAAGRGWSPGSAVGSS